MNKAGFQRLPGRQLLGPLLLDILLGHIPTAPAADDVLPQKVQSIETLRRRAEKLTFSGIVPAAIAQAETLLDALEKKQAGTSIDTPQQLPGSDSVRPDLWNQIAALKKDKSLSCAQRPIAKGSGMGRT